MMVVTVFTKVVVATTIAVTLSLQHVKAFSVPSSISFVLRHHSQAIIASRVSTCHLMADKTFEMELDMPPTGSALTARLKFQSVLDVPSEIVEVRYKIPFGLDVAPKNNFAVCTKDGAGGEKVGDILRFTSQWTMGLPRGNGIMTTVASFGGALSWQCSLFDVMKASRWEEVVEALTSNVDSRTDEVVLLFERPLT